MSFNFFQNKECEYFPCHKVGKLSEDKFSCLFCYCPLYKEKCEGYFILLPNGIKDCSNCLLPHYNYDYIVKKLININESQESYKNKIKV